MLQSTAKGQDTVQANQQRRFRPTEIEGLVIDQTITKMGHDFYDVFYAQWEPPQDLGDFTVVIREKPSRGINSLVSLEVNENELLELPLQPRYEIIEEAAAYGVEVALGYLINAKNVGQQLEQGPDNPGKETF
ncbi:CsgE family curli-type amyloid fiber assembly protein [Hymenobacter cavernae]|uniref:CsgE family curli-type amyloid fiber assembly protein n=1 Tax=Hymenobacter cavernae TaxID=2044852 RepID=UPI001662994C|nr:CsgE family curli-type amyloid fiber assembly protein [Hymenobacter cavernae]